MVVTPVEIAAAAKVALWLFQRISSAQNAQTAFIEFGQDTKHLSHTLEQLGEIVQEGTDGSTLRATDRFNVRPFQPEELESLQQICGDYKKTLEECKTLLRTHGYISTQGSLLGDIIWSVSVEARVARLRAKIQLHIVKIQSVLGSLQLQLSSNLFQLVQDAHRDIVDRMGMHFEQSAQELLLLRRQMNAGGSVAVANGTIPLVASTMEIPPEVERRLSSEAYIDEYSERRDTDALPLALATDAFLAHFQQSTKTFKPGAFLHAQTPSPLQYLNLLKSIWLMQRIKSHRDISIASPDSLWSKVVFTWNRELELESRRFQTTTKESERLRAPTLEDVLQLPLDAFQVWLEDDMDGSQILFEEKEYMEELLDTALPDARPNTEHRLIVLRSDSSSLRIIDSVFRNLHRGTQNNTEKHNVDLRRVQLVPLYASPGATAQAHNLKFNAEGKPASWVSVSFDNIRTLLRFQHAVTGYKVVFDKRDVETECYISQTMSAGLRIRDKGRVQLWLPKKLEKMTQTGPENSSPSTVSESSPSNANNANFEPKIRRASTSRSLISYATDPISTPARSAFSRASPIETGTGSRGFLHKRPKRPMLVIFSDTGKNQLGFRAVKIDKRTFINRATCSCHRSSDTCCRSSVETMSGSLDALRLPPRDDLDTANLAALGEEQQEDSRNTRPENGLKWVMLTFANVKDREEFGGKLCKCSASDSKDKNPSWTCNLEHRGSFGKVKNMHEKNIEAFHQRANLPAFAE